MNLIADGEDSDSFCQEIVVRSLEFKLVFDNVDIEDIHKEAHLFQDACLHMIELHTGPAIAYFLLYSWHIRAVKEDICPTLVIRDDILWLRWLEMHRLLTHCCSFRCNCVNSGGLEHGI